MKLQQLDEEKMVYWRRNCVDNNNNDRGVRPLKLRDKKGLRKVTTCNVRDSHGGNWKTVILASLLVLCDLLLLKIV